MRNVLKTVLGAVSALLVLPLYLQTKALAVFLRTDQPFQMASHTLSLCPGIVGNYLRKAFYQMTLPRCGTDVCIEFGTILHQPTIEIGHRVYIGCHCSIGDCVIHDDVLMGSNVDVISGTHQHSFRDRDVPIREQGGRFERIAIGEDSWIGNSSVIMANIGRKSVVAAASVVIRDIEPYSIVAGHPAVLIRRR